MVIKKKSKTENIYFSSPHQLITLQPGFSHKKHCLGLGTEVHPSHTYSDIIATVSPKYPRYIFLITNLRKWHESALRKLCIFNYFKFQRKVLNFLAKS